MSELLPKDLHVLSHNYYNVPGIKAVDKSGNTHTYTNLNREVLGIESNGIYTPPAGSAYETVAINVQDTTGYFDLTTWAGLGRLAASGYAPYMLEVGGIINGTYTLTNGTAYDYPWIIVDFQDVELENGTVRKNVPILQAQYLNHDYNITFDPAEQTIATEGTAQEGFYYVGYTSSYTLLDLDTGDTIPYDSYTTIYKTLWNTTYIVQMGNPAWALSYARQYLNNSGTSYWIAQHACDVAPSSIDAGFMTYMPSNMLSVISPIKRTTVRPSYMGNSVDVTYDKFWIASLSELNYMITSDISDSGNAPWEYYKEILDSETPVSSGAYSALIRHPCDSSTNRDWWTCSSRSSGNANAIIIQSNGYMYASTAPSNNNYKHVLPCCALTGA